MTSRLDSRFLGCVLVAAIGCAAPDRAAPETPQVLQVTLTAQTPAGLPSCTKALYGTTAATESPAGIWTCQAGAWLPIPCTNILAGAVAYSSATKSLWACTAGQWVNVVLPPGPAGAKGDKGDKGDTGAPGTNGKSGAMSIVVQTVEPPGANCADGGTRITSGTDLDGDQQIDHGEPAQVTYVCNGAAGASGAPGTLVTVTPEPPGANCRSGRTARRRRRRYERERQARRQREQLPLRLRWRVDDASRRRWRRRWRRQRGRGPVVTCRNRAPGGVLEIEPGTVFTLSDTVEDRDAVATLKVNGVATPVASDGTFTARLTARYGLNHVEVETADRAGTVTAYFCSFLAAGQFVDEGTAVADAVTLRLNQGAIDDGNRVGPINSLADALAAAINSDGLVAMLNKGLTAANPLYEEGPFTVTFLSSSLPGPNTVSALLVDGGVKLHVRFEHPKARLRAFLDLGPVGFDTTGDVDVDFVDVEGTFDIGQDPTTGRPHATLRGNATTVTVGTIDTNFDGSLGAYLNAIVNIANGIFKQSLTDTLRTAITSNIQTAIDGIVSNLDVHGFESTFAVPRFDGTGNTMLSFVAGVSGVEATTARLLVGSSSRLTAPAAHVREPFGVPVPSGVVRLDPAGTQSVAVSVHIGVLQQALQANWRGGGLDGTVAAARGANVAFTTTLPPVVFVQERWHRGDRSRYRRDVVARRLRDADPHSRRHSRSCERLAGRRRSDLLGADDR